MPVWVKFPQERDNKANADFERKYRRRGNQPQWRAEGIIMNLKPELRLSIWKRWISFEDPYEAVKACKLITNFNFLRKSDKQKGII